MLPGQSPFPGKCFLTIAVNYAPVQVKAFSPKRLLR
jgi:hypothetical protein